ncbi:MAG TPA: outer membrane beta-barrel protein [Caulobacteraceae bacterium]|nr:outer membrane beta-barrel protein [Caulobacteraceae bacterium]
MNKLVALIAAAAALTAGPAAAQMYGSVGYSSVASSDDVVDVTLGALTARGGSHFSRNFGAELEGSIGIQDDTFDFSGVEVDVGLNYHVGAYLVAFLPVSEQFELHARAGVASVEVEAEAGGVEAADVSGSGFEVGAGATYYFVGNHGVRADYTRSEAIDANIFSVGYAFRFGAAAE